MFALRSFADTIKCAMTTTPIRKARSPGTTYQGDATTPGATPSSRCAPGVAHHPGAGATGRPVWMRKKEDSDLFSKDLDPDERMDEDEEVERVVRCATCDHVVAKAEDRFIKDGREDHVFTNPEGLTFQIACWREAPGCAGFGQESDEWAWFPGWTWQVAVCAGCLTHLGWFFRRDASSFVGLILDRIVI